MVYYSSRNPLASYDSIEAASLYAYQKADRDTLLDAGNGGQFRSHISVEEYDEVSSEPPPIPRAIAGKYYISISSPKASPQLEFKPLLLKTWILLITFLAFRSFFAALVHVIWEHHSNLDVFYIDNLTNYVLASNVPALFGTISTLRWRAIVQTYNRVFLYIAMSKTPKLTRS
ncbi:hypothetical protein K469DRAFT_689928 [Zopfia rhizophila CBS 207.26]|uniref:Uncharacterized protein n=1 Tax=Zopfia rhizophila CBS 207.26 TaxID=1314779 RepID=A0A6A6DUX0_9PEZI|nr:hypothetical protein K469DRAFT_689928 [Zopfia rhizophila CBS 207.26]